MLNLFSCQRLIAPRCWRRTSLHRLAAVDNHRVPDDEGGRVRTQPQDGRGDLLGRPHPADRLLRDHRCAPLWGAPAEPLHHLGVDDPGADGVYADVGRRVVEGGRFAEADHAVFGGDVRGSTWEALDPGARGGIHDRAAPLLEHQRNLVLHAQEHAAEVDGDGPVPLLLRDVAHRLDLVFHAGVVEGDVQPPERFDGLVQGRLHVLASRHVAGDGESALAEFFDPARRVPNALFRDVGDDHAGALACERQRRGAADATACTGYERDLSRGASVLISCHVLLYALLIVSSVVRSHALPKPELLLNESPDHGVGSGSTSSRISRAVRRKSIKLIATSKLTRATTRGESLIGIKRITNSALQPNISHRCLIYPPPSLLSAARL